MHPKTLAACGAAMLWCAAALGSDEKPKGGCHDPSARQFDFWIGRWQVSQAGKPAGNNHIEKILDGCALLENWTGAQGGTGKSLNFFDRDDWALAPDLDRRQRRRAAARGSFREWRDALVRRAPGDCRPARDPPSHHVDTVTRWQAAPALGIHAIRQ
jgi:hypothetical protein